jgi:hypothetical protein
MDTPLTVAIISAGAIVVPAISFYLTKSKERQADWLRYKFDLYNWCNLSAELWGRTQDRRETGVSPLPATRFT